MTGWQTTRELLGTASARVTQDGVGPEGQSLAGWRHRHVAHLRQVPRPRRLCPLPPSRAAPQEETGAWGEGRLGEGISDGPQHRLAPPWSGAWRPSQRSGQCRLTVASHSCRRAGLSTWSSEFDSPSPSPHASIPTTRDRWRWELSPLEASFQGAQATCLPVSQGHSPKVPIAASAAQTPVGGPRPHVLPPRRLSVEPGPPPRGQQPSQSTCDA